MSFTYAATILGARKLVNDSAVPYRAIDDDMLGWTKEGVAEAVLLRPDLFAIRGAHTCVAGAEQILLQARAIYLVDVIGITGGAIVEEAHYMTLRQFRPGFRQDTAAAAENWLRHPEDVNRPQTKRFVVYPPALLGQSLDVLYSEAPDQSLVTTATMAADVMPLDDMYFNAMQTFVMHKHEALNDEAPNPQRAAVLYTQFVALMGANKVAPRE